MTDVPSSGRSAELRALAQRLIEIADQQDMANHEEAGQRRRPAAEPEFSVQFLRGLALGIYRRRRRRADYFDSALFGEIAWDMLLDLYAHSIEGKLVSTTSLCLAAEAPVATGLRWIAQLEAKGLVARHASQSDARVTYVSITEGGQDAMKRFLTRECAPQREADGFLLTT